MVWLEQNIISSQNFISFLHAAGKEEGFGDNRSFPFI